MSIKIPKKYWYIAKRLSTAQLQKSSDDDSLISEADLFNVNIGKRGRGFFLGYYSKEGLKLVFEKYDVIKLLSNKGFNEIVYELDTSDQYIHRLVVYEKYKKPDKMLIEIVLKKETVTIDMPFETKLNGKRFDTLAIEWLSMQNPHGQFTTKRPKLPGQDFPGLGISNKAVELLIIASWRLKLAGLLNTPEYYHNAYIYSKVFFYTNPEDQARLNALARDTKKYPLDVVSWAMEWGAIKDEVTAQPAKWFVAKQLVALDSELKKLFNSKMYWNIVKEKAKEYKFTLNMAEYEKARKTKGDLNEA